jgi:UDP-N-acetylglucosamine 2-epimerase (non-hydrolysing)
MATLEDISHALPLVFTVHPRTLARLESLGYASGSPGFYLMEPVGYLDSLALQSHAAVVVTDSGGMQEETSYLGTPCVTVRENTERPVTMATGTNTLVGRDMARLRAEVDRVLAGTFKRGELPPFWDGRAAERIADALELWNARG